MADTGLALRASPSLSNGRTTQHHNTPSSRLPDTASPPQSDSSSKSSAPISVETTVSRKVGVIKASNAFKTLRRRTHEAIHAKLEVDAKDNKGLDVARRQAQAYEYLCHLAETKEWIEACIDCELPPVTELEKRIANGVVLCKLAHFFCPELVKARNVYDPDETFYEKKGISFRHTDNIARWLAAMRHVGLPDYYYPDMTDVYELKNVPRVIFCIHALSVHLHKKGVAPQIRSLRGVARFSMAELHLMDRKLDQGGIVMPKFETISVHEGNSAAAPLDLSEVIQDSSVIVEETPSAEPYNVWWPFAPDDEFGWVASEPMDSGPLDITVTEFLETLDEQRLDDETSVFELMTLLTQHFPHLKEQLAREDDDDSRRGTSEELSVDTEHQELVASFTEEEADLYDRADRLLQLQTDDMFWDSLYWGVATPYFIHWPFRVNEAGRERVDPMLAVTEAVLNSVLLERRIALMDKEVSTILNSSYQIDRLLAASAARTLAAELEGEELSATQVLDVFLLKNFPSVYQRLVCDPALDDSLESEPEAAPDGSDATLLAPPTLNRGTEMPFGSAADLLAREEREQATEHWMEAWDEMYWGHTPDELERQRQLHHEAWNMSIVANVRHIKPSRKIAGLQRRSSSKAATFARRASNAAAQGLPRLTRSRATSPSPSVSQPDPSTTDSDRPRSPRGAVRSFPAVAEQQQQQRTPSPDPERKCRSVGRMASVREEDEEEPDEPEVPGGEPDEAADVFDVPDADSDADGCSDSDGFLSDERDGEAELAHEEEVLEDILDDEVMEQLIELIMDEVLPAGGAGDERAECGDGEGGVLGGGGGDGSGEEFGGTPDFLRADAFIDPDLLDEPFDELGEDQDDAAALHGSRGSSANTSLASIDTAGDHPSSAPGVLPVAEEAHLDATGIEPVEYTLGKNRRRRASLGLDIPQFGGCKSVAEQIGCLETHLETLFADEDPTDESIALIDRIEKELLYLRAQEASAELYGQTRKRRSSEVECLATYLELLQESDAHTVEAEILNIAAELEAVEEALDAEDAEAGEDGFDELEEGDGEHRDMS